MQYEINEYYRITDEISSREYIFKIRNIKDTMISAAYISSDGYFTPNSSTFANIDYIKKHYNNKPAIQEEVQWLDKCIEVNKFISKEEALRRTKIPEYVECIKQVHTNSTPKIGEIIKANSEGTLIGICTYDSYTYRTCFKPSTKEAYDAQLNKEIKFEVGKWYKIEDWRSKAVNCIENSNSILRYSEFIDESGQLRKITNEIRKDLYKLNDVTKEIQQYLSENHPDKIKINTMKFKKGDKVHIPRSKNGHMWYLNNQGYLDDYYYNYFIIDFIDFNIGENIKLKRVDDVSFRNCYFNESDLTLYEEEWIPKTDDWITIENSNSLQNGCTECPKGTWQIVNDTNNSGLLSYKEGFNIKVDSKIWRISTKGVRKALPHEIPYKSMGILPQIEKSSWFNNPSILSCGGNNLDSNLLSGMSFEDKWMDIVSAQNYILTNSGKVSKTKGFNRKEFDKDPYNQPLQVKVKTKTNKKVIIKF